jgi:hypothetical protein
LQLVPICWDKCDRYKKNYKGREFPSTLLRPSALHFVLRLSVEGRLRLEEMVNLSFDFAQDSELVELLNHIPPLF